VFADLGFADAEERQTKLRLAYALNTIMDEQGVTQAAAAARLGLNQPKVSALRNYKLEGFSVERLMTLLNALDQDIEIVIRAAALARRRASVWWRRDLSRSQHERSEMWDRHRNGTESPGFRFAHPGYLLFNRRSTSRQKRQIQFR
jgi:predicted XRE-type DNA-binding protein